MKNLVIVLFSVLMSFQCFAQKDLGYKVGEDRDFVELYKLVGKLGVKGEIKDKVASLERNEKVAALSKRLKNKYPELEKVTNDKDFYIAVQCSLNSVLSQGDPTPEQDLNDCLLLAENASLALGAAVGPIGAVISVEILTESCIRIYQEATAPNPDDGCN